MLLGMLMMQSGSNEMRSVCKQMNASGRVNTQQQHEANALRRMLPERR